MSVREAERVLKDILSPILLARDGGVGLTRRRVELGALRGLAAVGADHKFKLARQSLHISRQNRVPPPPSV